MIAGILIAVLLEALPVSGASSLHLTYPPDQHRTTAGQIFLIGTAPAQGQVRVNGHVIARSPAGHFAPSFPLRQGANPFSLQYEDQNIQITVHRISEEPTPPAGLTFGKDSLQPAVDIARLPGELLQFRAAAPLGAQVLVKLGELTVPLRPRLQNVDLPPNKAIFTQLNQPIPKPPDGLLEGCAPVTSPGNLGHPQFQLTLDGQTFTQTGLGTIEILTPGQLPLIRVSAGSGVARTGPGNDFSRLTPLPQGTQASVTGREGEWLRLDYGGWIQRREVQELAPAMPPPHSLIRSLQARVRPGWTEVVFPLQVPVPIQVEQTDDNLTLTLFNTTAQTDTIRFDRDPLIARLDWRQAAPGQVRYVLQFTSRQQWGYTLRYEGTTLILGLRHPPRLLGPLPLSGISILLELGFMTHPEEYEWVVDPREQKKLASALAEGIAQWLLRVRTGT